MQFDGICNTGGLSLGANLRTRVISLQHYRGDFSGNNKEEKKEKSKTFVNSTFIATKQLKKCRNEILSHSSVP